MQVILYKCTLFHVTQRPNRHFLFLQGPHGPFFHRLGLMLCRAGAEVWRVGFNAGDRAFSFGDRGFIPFTGAPSDWPDTFAALVAEHQITDIVLYGDVRPIHAQAVAAAKDMGLPFMSSKKATCGPIGSPTNAAGPMGIRV